MLKLLILLVLTTVFIMQSLPAYCAGTRVISLQVSATLPEHVMANSINGIPQFSDSPMQLVQTETVIRNNQSIRLVSIVVP